MNCRRTRTCRLGEVGPCRRLERMTGNHETIRRMEIFTFRRSWERDYFPRLVCSNHSPDETCKLQNPSHVADTSVLSGPTHKG